MPEDKTKDTRNLIDRFKGKEVDSIKNELSQTAFAFHIAIENLQHDFNIGSIVRSANAFNASGVHIIGKRHWNKRGAMSTEKYLCLYHHKDAEEFLEWAIKNKMSVIGIDNIEGCTSLNEANLPKDAVFVFGQEGPGLTPELMVVCEQVIGIEQFGSTRSVNVGAAAAIVMYEWVRRNSLG